jgi:adenylylsulfate kinase
VTLVGPSRRGGVLWLTGLPSAGKTTVSELVSERLARRGLPVEVLDGDVVRTHLSRGLGFSKVDRDTNIRRIGFVARLLARHGVTVLVAAVSPYREARDGVRREVEAEGGFFVEVYVRCPLEVAIERDRKGMYALARAGKLAAFTGISDPYEPPLSPEVVLDTHEETPELSAARLLAYLETARLVP